jgi:hypothetical protein
MEKVLNTAPLLRLIIQLVITEIVSICFFLPAGSHLGFGFTLRLGLGAPVILAFLPLWALKDGDYVGAIVASLIDLGFLLLIAFSIINNRWKFGGISLLLFNVASFVLSLNW